MISSKLKIYFKTNINNPSVDFIWSDEDNKKIFIYLNKLLSQEELQETRIQLEIKQAFREYFESVGYILITIKDNQIRLKIFPYTIEPKDSINLDTIIEILESNENLIEYDYNGKEDLISVNKLLKDEIFLFLDKQDEEINKKELVKYAIREAFELEQRDIVVIKVDQIIIKLLDDESMQEVKEDAKNTVANRYNGINEDDLKSFYDDVFSQEENEDFFYYVAEVFVDVYILDKRIDNKEYEQAVFPIIQSIVSEKLINHFDRNDEFFKGFSGYVFRIHFKEVFNFMAELILTELAENNDVIINFLKYYSLNVVILNGKKYKVPEIEADNGWKWNVASMMSIIKVFIKAEIALEVLEEDIETLDKEIVELYVSKVSPVAYNNALTSEIEKLHQDITYGAKRLDLHIDSLKDESDSVNLKREIRDIRHDLHGLRDEKEKLASKLISRDIILNYTELKRNMDTMLRQKVREESTIEKNEKSYVSIKDALVKALTSKKKLI